MSKIMALVLCGGAAALSMLSPFSMLRHSQLALADRRVLVTAPRIDAGPLAAALIQAGAHPLWRPTVRIAPLAEDAVGELDECIMRLSDYDVLLLSNRHALDAVVARGTALADGDSEVFRLMLRASAAEIAASSGSPPADGTLPAANLKELYDLGLGLEAVACKVTAAGPSDARAAPSYPPNEPLWCPPPGAVHSPAARSACACGIHRRPPRAALCTIASLWNGLV